MTGRPPLVLCSGSLGSAPLVEKIRAASLAGFGWISIYGSEYREAIAAGDDPAALCRELDLRVAEVDGVAISMQSAEMFDEALAIAVVFGARSITIVETGDYDPLDENHVASAVEAFGQRCDRAATSGILVHLEPFAWSSLNRTVDAAIIAERADRANGGVLLDYWHHVRGPDQGVLDPAIPMRRIFGIQLADTLARPWDNVRDECMTQRQLPGTGHADLSRRLTEIATRGALPPIGIEVFGEVLADRSPLAAAQAAFEAIEHTLSTAGI